MSRYITTTLVALAFGVAMAIAASEIVDLMNIEIQSQIQAAKWVWEMWR